MLDPKVQQPADQCRRATHLVGLGRLVEPLADHVRLPLQQREESGGAAVRLPRAADTRVVGAERTSPTFEHQPVHAAEQAQRQGRLLGVVLVSPKDLRRGPAGLDVVREPAEQLGVQR